MMRSEAYRYCVDHACGQQESQIYMRIARLHNYYIYRIFMHVVKLKNKLLDGSGGKGSYSDYKFKQER